MLRRYAQYPTYLSSHADLPADERKRFGEQLRLSREILAIFEAPGYSDEDTKAQAEVFRLMNEVGWVTLRWAWLIIDRLS
jgi:hypothetical protein